MPVENDILASAGRQSHDTEYYSPVPDGYQRGRHRYVAVFGTVMSGLGKGIFASSTAKLLKDKGLRVSPIKMEGYLNIDSGTLNPYRHGEVFVLDDGMETDMDLGTYERMLDQDLTRDNFTTSGQIYKTILDKERHGKYLGRDVQMIPHVTGEVKHILRSLAVKQQADVVFIEVGGTVGDFENAFYIEALRELAFEEGPNSVAFVALTYVIEPKALGEQKSKAAQLGIKRLMELGVQPHLIACRARHPVSEKVLEKIAMYSNVPQRRVFSMHDRDSVYMIPEAMHNEGLDLEILTILNLHDRVKPAAEDKARQHWSRFVSILTGKRKHAVRVGITGKYAGLRDAYASIDKALEHAGAHLSADIQVDWLDTIDMDHADPAAIAAQLEPLDAVIVPGGFGHRGAEGKISAVHYCRTHNTPFLGICLGFQMAVLEYARHLCNLPDAASTEFEPAAATPVIDILPEQKKIEGLGGNMRLGGKEVALRPNSLAAFLYRDQFMARPTGKGRTPVSVSAAHLNAAPPHAAAHASTASYEDLPADSALRLASPDLPVIRQRFRHRYEVDPAYIPTLERHGLVFSGRHPLQPIMQVLELPLTTHPYFIGAQFHPELLSRPLRPSPMFAGLIAAAIRHRSPDLSPEQISPRWVPPFPPEVTTAGSASERTVGA